MLDKNLAMRCFLFGTVEVVLKRRNNWNIEKGDRV